MPKVFVAFPHKGEDGKARQVGQVVEVSETEARRRIADGFVSLVTEEPAAKQEDEKPEPKKRAAKAGE